MIATVLLLTASPATLPAQGEVRVDAADVSDAARVAGLSFTPEEVELMMPDVLERMAAFDELRSTTLSNGVAPAMIFSPWIPGIEPRASQRVLPMPGLPEWRGRRPRGSGLVHRRTRGAPAEDGRHPVESRRCTSIGWSGSTRSCTA